MSQGTRFQGHSNQQPVTLEAYTLPVELYGKFLLAKSVCWDFFLFLEPEALWWSITIL